MHWLAYFLRYRPPEILLGSVDYNSEIDMWYVKCSARPTWVCVCMHACVCACVLLHVLHVFKCACACIHACVTPLPSPPQGCWVHLLRDGHWQANVPWGKCGGGVRTYMEGIQYDPVVNVVCGHSTVVVNPQH